MGIDELRRLADHGVLFVEFLPRLSSPLYFPSATVKLRMDRFIGPSVLVGHQWQINELLFAREILRDRLMTLVDIGGNYGLTSRQMLATTACFNRAFVYEPDPVNFAVLSHNLAPFWQVSAKCAGLGFEDRADVPFFEEHANAGNFSFTAEAMQDAPHSTITVQMLDAAQESRRWLDGGPIFYKSDAQGFDEVIMTRVDPDVWAHCVGGIMEVWRIEKPAVDHNVVRTILDRFPNKCFIKNTFDMAAKVSTDDVLAYAAGRDGEWSDLAFWK